MLRTLAQRMLARYGVDLHDAASVPQPAPPPQVELDPTRFVDMLARDPLNGDLHLRYAAAASATGAPYLALAEVETARFLGVDPVRSRPLADAYRRAIPDAIDMNHNQYFRFITLAAEITRLAGSESASILDVGGGDGRLASFLPEFGYCLAEPTVNGISGLALPFDDEAFDYVVFCHVLEHVPPRDRDTFLDQLLAKSRRGIVMLNPFQVDGTHIEARLQLIMEITGAPWAKEHLDCGLPTLADLEHYSNSRGLRQTIKPNGTLATTLAFVFMDYFAAKAGAYDQWAKVNAFFNERLVDLLDSSSYPNAYLVSLEKSVTQTRRRDASADLPPTA